MPSRVVGGLSAPDSLAQDGKYDTMVAEEQASKTGAVFKPAGLALFSESPAK